MSCADIQVQIERVQHQIDSILNDPEPAPGGGPHPVPQRLLDQLAALGKQLSTCTTPGVYRCDDGAAYYTAQVGTTFCWFGEQADGAFANIFVGERTGATITGPWFDIPKGHASSHGMLTLTIDDAAGTLTRVSQTGGFGGAHWTLDHPFGADGVPLATTAFRRARYQGDPASELTGTWKTNDGGTAYVRELRSPPLSTVVWLAESTSESHVFHGTVDRGRTTIRGSWMTIPKSGGATATGQATLRISPEATFAAASLTVIEGTLPVHVLDRVEAIDVVIHLDQFRLIHTFPNRPVFVAGPPYQVVKPGTGGPFGPPAVLGHYELRAESGDEPYLWTLLATIDGSTVSFGDLSHGHAVIVSRPGSHNDLTTREDLGPGTVLAIPPALGRFTTTLMTIRKLDRAQAKSSTTLVAAAIALEHDDLDDHVMESGHAALIRVLQQKLDDAVHSGQAPDDATVDQWVKDLQAAATTAAEDAVSTADKVLIGLGFKSRDATVGAARAIVSYADLEASAASGRALTFNFPETSPSYVVTGRIDVTVSARAPSGVPPIALSSTPRG